MKNTRKVQVGDNVTLNGRSWAVTGISRGSEKIARLCVPGNPQDVIFAYVHELTDPGPWR